MELNLNVIKKHNMYIISFEGLPGCWTYSKGNISQAITSAYEALSEWEKSAFHSGFACFQACLTSNFKVE